MANTFDKIFKEESEILIKAIATKILGIDSFDKTEPVTATLQKTIEREPDWLRKICHDDKRKDYIFHGEVHGKDQAIILDRNLVYYSLLWSSYHLPVRQVVVYIGRKRKLTKMNGNLTHPNVQFRFEIINMYEVPYEIFINSDEPAEVILSILCDFKDESAETIIPKILNRLKELDDSGLKLEKHLVQLEIIADLRNLQPLLTKIMDTMPITYDLKRDIRYNQGKDLGKVEGKLEEKQLFVVRLLQEEGINKDKISNFADVSLAFVEKTQKAYEKGLQMIENKKCTVKNIVEATGLMQEVVEKYILK
jgi:hypothetical protein